MRKRFTTIEINDICTTKNISDRSHSRRNSKYQLITLIVLFAVGTTTISGKIGKNCKKTICNREKYVVFPAACCYNTVKYSRSYFIRKIS
jgi:hypothetical protein